MFLLVQKAGTFQRKLMRINEHRVCALEDSRNDLEKTRSELLKVKASIIKRETEGENSVPKSSSSNTCSNEVTPAVSYLYYVKNLRGKLRPGTRV